MSIWQESAVSNGRMIMGGSGGTTVFLGPEGVIVWAGGPDTYRPREHQTNAIRNAVERVQAAIGEYHRLINEVIDNAVEDKREFVPETAR